MAHYWDWYCEVKGGGNTLTYTELQAWAELKRIPLTAVDTEVLFRVDSVVNKELASG